MSSPQFEAFLARLYCDRDFLQEFMRESDRVVREAGLSERERHAAIAIDRAGLLMAVRSYELKRHARTKRSGVRKWVSELLYRLRDWESNSGAPRS
jgi:hypothetical protein